MLRPVAALLLPLWCAGAVHPVAVLPGAQITAATLDSNENVYVAGLIQSAGLPVTPGAFQSQFHPGTCAGPLFAWPCPDGFVAKFDSSGNLVYASYIGGSGYDVASAIAVDGQGNAYVAGFSASEDFPLTARQINADPANGAFALKIDPAGARLLYSTRLPGISDVTSIAVDGAGQLHVAGSASGPGLPVTPGAIQPGFRGDTGYADSAVMKLSAGGDHLLMATYLGGSRDDRISALALDREGNIYVAGATASSDFPYTAGALDTRPATKGYFYDAFVAKLNSSGTRLIYAARPSGSCNDQPQGLALDETGRAFVTGRTCSGDYPIVRAPAASEAGLISSAAFATVVSADGASIEYSALLGGSQSSQGFTIALDAESRIVVGGGTLDPDFPTTADAPARCNPAAASQTRGFLVRLDPADPADRFATYLDVAGNVLPLSGGRFLAAGGDGSGDGHILVLDAQAPQELGVQCVANAASGWSAAVAAGELVTVYGSDLSGADVFFDELPAPVLASSDDRITTTVPPELAGRPSSQLRVIRDQTQSEPVTVTLVDAAPGVFRLGTGPTNLAAVLNQDGTVNGSGHPAPRGSVIAFWATGIGPGPLRVGFFGFPGEIEYAGPAPGMAAGISQINVLVPTKMGPFSYPVDLVLSSGDIFMPVRLTVDIQ